MEDRVDGAQMVGPCSNERVTATLQISCVITLGMPRSLVRAMCQDCSEAVGDVLDIAMAGDVEAL